MLTNKIRIYKDVSPNEVKRVSQLAGISPFIAKILLNRGINDIEYIKKFLNPSLNDLHDPFLLTDMDKAAERIIRAIKNCEKILIYGDYDVDGVTSTSIMYNFLTGQNAIVEYYIPDRLDEGYGLSIGAIKKLINKDISVIITVDCGITAIDEVDFINRNNIDTIITDHHKCRETLPKAYAVVNPQRPDCTYPFKSLAGVGVAYKLIQAICIKLELGEIYLEYLDLVAIGTVADVVQLIDENRAIVKYGINMIENSANTGLRVLIDNCGIKEKAVTTFGISFAIAPRINAAGRLGSAERAVQLFTTANTEVSKNLVDTLNEENKLRQEAEAEIMTQVLSEIEIGIDLEKEKVIVVAGQGWQHGVIGIAASKVTERFYRPCILISNENGLGKGSGRSIEGFDLHEGLHYCKNLLDQYGGHQMAAGLSLQESNIPAFRKMINEYADLVMTEQDLIAKIRIDIDLEKEDLSPANIKDIEMLAPFGAGNPAPIFEYKGCVIQEIRTVGENRHLKLKLENDSNNIDAIGFNMGSCINDLNKYDKIDVACALEINTWNSIDRIQLNLRDIKLKSGRDINNDYFFRLDKCLDAVNFCSKEESEKQLKDLKNTFIKEDVMEEIVNGIVPDRADMIAVYRYFKSCDIERIAIQDIYSYVKNINEDFDTKMNYFKLKKSIEIFEELKLIKKERNGQDELIITITDIEGKTKIESSEIYKRLLAIKDEFKGA